MVILSIKIIMVLVRILILDIDLVSFVLNSLHANQAGTHTHVHASMGTVNRDSNFRAPHNLEI